MSGDSGGIKPEAVDTALGEMKLEEGSDEGKRSQVPDLNGVRNSATATPKSSRSQTPAMMESSTQTPKSEEELQEDNIDEDVLATPEPGKAPKLSRKASQKIVSRPPPLFDDLPDSTEEATSKFQVIRDCLYGSKYMGSSEHEALGCDCSEEWHDGQNHACGEDSDCINRATKMECVDDECNCGAGCQNQRFQRKQFAKVSVIKTEKKGYGLRADTDLEPNTFIFEYIGEVINEPVFRRRTIQYDEEGIKHFYFMSLTKSEFVDATKKGNLGRFCNHSCNPNCYVDKWVVGDKLRMGIFAERRVKAGEELVFNYNVDRYGADPQPCYCGEPNCTGFIGGKTQTERATKLSHTTIEALGIEDGDGWDTAVAKRPRKKKQGEDDEDYVNAVEPKGLDEGGVTKVMATLMQCKEKWIAVKLLNRIQRAEDERVRNRVIRMHGYQVLRTILTTFQDDNNVVLQVLDILYKFPRLSKNKIEDAKIEPVIEPFTKSEHEDVAFESKRLLEEWSKLQVAYRIKRKKFDPNAQALNHFDRRGGERQEEVPASAPSPTVAIPTGPRNSIPQRIAPRPINRPPPMRRQFSALPSGWFAALDQHGNTYYYSKSGQTTWQRPNIPAVEPLQQQHKSTPKAIQDQKALQNIIDSLTKVDPTPKTLGTPKPAEEIKEKKPEKWRSYTADKQMKIYENTLFPHVNYVMNKFRHKLPKDDLKKFAKEISKKLVSSDYKNNRVEDPTSITSKHEKKVRKHVREFFEKAVKKKADYDKKKAAKKVEALANGTASSSNLASGAATPVTTEADSQIEDLKADVSDVEMSDDEDDAATPTTDETLKRKREENATPGDTPDAKRTKDEDVNGPDEPSPPPPPPPPPAEELMEQELDPETMAQMREEEDLRKQEEELMRENEEAEAMEKMKAEQESGNTKDTAQTNGNSFGTNGALNIQNGMDGTSNGEKDGKADMDLEMEGMMKKEVLSH